MYIYIDTPQKLFITKKSYSLSENIYKCVSSQYKLHINMHIFGEDMGI